MTLIARYKLDRDALDSSGNEYDAAIASDIVYTTGQVNNAIQTYESGTNLQYLEIPYSSGTFNYTGGNLSISLWHKWDSTENDTSTANSVISKVWNSSGEINYGLVIFNGQFRISIRGATLIEVQTNDSVPQDTLYHIVVVLDGTAKEYRLYINNSLVHTEDFSSIVSWTPGSGVQSRDLCIGTFFPYGVGSLGNRPTFTCQGDYDDVRIYDHALSLKEINYLFNYRGTVEVEIAGKDYSRWLVGCEYETSINLAARSAFLSFVDAGQSIRDAIDSADDVRIDVSGQIKFRGEIRERDWVNYRTEITATDYFDLIAERDITETYSGQTAKQIIVDITTNYLDSLRGNIYFNSTNVDDVDPSKVFDFDFSKGFAAADIFRDLAVQVNAVVFIEPGSGNNLNIHFHQHGYSHSGYIADWDAADGSLRALNLPKKSRMLRNVVLVHGDQVSVVVRDPVSVGKYGERHAQPVHHKDATTTDMCRFYGNLELAKWKDPIETGQLTIMLDLDVEGGELVTITDSRHNLSTQDFLVIDALVNVLPNKRMILNIAEVDAGQIEQTTEMVKKIRRVDLRDVADAVTFQQFEVIQEYAGAYFAFNMSREDQLDAQIGNATTPSIGNMNIGTISGRTVQQSGNMVLTNTGKEAIRDLISGQSSAHLDNAGAHMGVGSGTTPATSGDSALETEKSRADQDAGFPNDPSTTESRMQGTFVDGSSGTLNELSVGETITEFGLLDAPSSGTLLARSVSPPITKTANTDITVEITLAIEEGISQ